MSRRRPRPFAVLALTLAVALLAVACSSGHGSAGTTTSTSAPTTLPTATAPASQGGSSSSLSTSGSEGGAPPTVDPVLEPLPAPGRPFAVTLQPDGLADPAAWPDACAMLTAAQLRAIVPAAASVSTQGQPGRLADGQETPHAASCTYRLRWTQDADREPGTVTIDLRNIASADPLASVFGDRRTAAATVAKDHPALYADYGDKLGGASCFFDGTALECVDGSFSFWVGGTDPRPAPPSASARADAWRNRVLAKVVALLAEKMTPGAASVAS